MITRLSRSGLSPRLFAIAGIDTAIIVESSPSMKKAQPTISGMRMRARFPAVAASGAPAWLTGAISTVSDAAMIEENGAAWMGGDLADAIES